VVKIGTLRRTKTSPIKLPDAIINKPANIKTTPRNMIKPEKYPDVLKSTVFIELRYVVADNVVVYHLGLFSNSVLTT